MVREDQASSFVGPLRSGIILCQSMAISDRPLSVREDQSSSVVIHCQSVAIQYHPMSVREDQSSSFVSLHQGMRLPDKQTRYRQADKQDNKEDHKVSGFGCSEAPSAYPPTTTTSSRLPRPADRRRRATGDENAAAVAAAACWSCGLGFRHFRLLFGFRQFFHFPHRASLAAACLLLFGMPQAQTLAASLAI